MKEVWGRHCVKTSHIVVKTNKTLNYYGNRERWSQKGGKEIGNKMTAAVK